MMNSGEIWADEILPGKLWIGAGRDAQNLTKLKENNITHILNVADDVPNYYKNSSEIKLEYLCLKVVDFGGDTGISRVFKDAATFVAHAHSPQTPTNDTTKEKVEEESKERQGRVLIHCANGSNRSATILLAVLMQNNNMSLAEAWELSRSKRRIQPLQDNRKVRLCAC